MQKTGRKPTHGKWKSKEWVAWDHMKRRCNSPKNADYKNYGARGISVCERWSSFENFYADMGDAPSPKHTLERIDNNGNYEKSNCKWATRKEQQRNIRTNRVIEYLGESKTVTEWAEELGMDRRVLYMRIRNGWSVEKTLTTPINR